MSPRRTALGVACIVVAASAAATVPASAADRRSVRPVGVQTVLGDERLSDERRLTRYAGAVLRAPIHVRPRPGARAVGRLRFLTEDGPFEVYPVLESRADTHGIWLRVRIPGRPNGRTGWVRRGALGPLRSVTTSLRIDRRTLRARLLVGGRQVWSSRIGVGAASTPTPRGDFWIRTRLRVPAAGGPYGPYAFGTGAYSVLSDWPGGGVVGIHGTDAPQLIPGRPSHGCVRVPNAALRDLWDRMPIGTPVTIR